MQRIGIISDIHGNMPALEAVIKDCQERKISKIICLGDLVGKGPHSDLVVDRVREVCDVVVRGNWDENIAEPSDWDANKWHQNRLGKERIQYLRNLPFSYDFYMSGKRIRLLHASPQSVHHRIYQNDSLEKRLEMFHNTRESGRFLTTHNEPDVVGYGDIHWSYVDYLRERTLFNTGSVGNSLERPDASYAVLEGLMDSDERGSFSISIVRVPYDNELSIQQAQELDMPDIEPYIKEVRTARYRGWKD